MIKRKDGELANHIEEIKATLTDKDVTGIYLVVQTDSVTKAFSYEISPIPLLRALIQTLAEIEQQLWNAGEEK